MTDSKQLQKSVKKTQCNKGNLHSEPWNTIKKYIKHIPEKVGGSAFT